MRHQAKADPGHSRGFVQRAPSPCPYLWPCYFIGPEASQTWGKLQGLIPGSVPRVNNVGIPRVGAAQKPPPATKARRRRRCWPGQREAVMRQAGSGLGHREGAQRSYSVWREGFPAPTAACPDHSSNRSQGCFVSLWGFPLNSQK